MSDIKLLIDGIAEILISEKRMDSVAAVQKALKIIKEEDYYNFYEDVMDYRDLAWVLVEDSILWEEAENEDMKEFLIENQGSEDVLKAYLNERGWYVVNGKMAICLDLDFYPDNTVIVEIEGGLVVAAHTNIKDLNILIVDRDNEVCSDDDKERNEELMRNAEKLKEIKL